MQQQKTTELYRISYSATIDTTSGTTPFHDEVRSESGVVHVKAISKEEAQMHALGQVQSKFGANWEISVGEASVANFANIWRDQTSEQLYNKYLINVNRDGGGNSLGFYERRAAARILARTQYQNAGEILLRWLNNPQEGIGKFCFGYEHSASHNEYPQDYNFADDSTPRDVTVMAAESLGLMRYEPARTVLEKLAKDVAIRKNDPTLGSCYHHALRRIQGQRTLQGEEADLEKDILLFIAATSPTEFFRSRLFKALVNQVFFDDPDYRSASSTKLAERYIESLRRVPDLEIPIIDENNLSDEYKQQSVRATDVVLTPKIGLISFLARQGMNMDIDNLEKICCEILNITRAGDGLSKGRNIYVDFPLFDGTTALVNDGLRKRILEYLEENHLFFHGGLIE